MQGASTSAIQKHTMVGDNMYGNCRLCFAIGQHQHTFGMAEMEILMENLNLFLLSDPRLPHLLCSDCITSLGAVQHFRQKVMATETQLLRVIAEGIKQTTTPSHVSMVLPSQNDPLDMGIVKTEHDADEHQTILKFEDDDDDDDDADDKEEAHQNESSMDMDTSLTNIKTEQDDFDQNNLLRNVVMTVTPGSAEIKNTLSITPHETQPAKETPTSGPRRKIRFSQNHIVQKSTGGDDEATTSTGSRGPRGKNAQYYRDYRARKRAEQEEELLNRTGDPFTSADSSTINVTGTVTSKKRKSAAEYQREYRARIKAKRVNRTNNRNLQFNMSSNPR